jgi:hypothetical protein
VPAVPRDFFVSYNSADRAWAEWIAWQLEESGFRVIVQAWDFRPGSNFVLEMDRAAKAADRTIAVLSPDYLEASFPQPEWAEPLANDPEGLRRALVPVRVRECQPAGLLSQVVYIDLVGLDEDAARGALLDGLEQRGKPEQPPAFPGGGSRPVPTEPGFPGGSEPPIGNPSPRDGEGTWVKLNELIFRAETVEDGGDEIRLSGEFTEDLSRRFERLRPSAYGQNRVRIVHGDRVVDANVQQVRKSDRAGRTEIEIQLDRVEAVRGSGMRAGAQGLSADDLVEAGLRHVLFDEQLPSSLGMLRFMADPGIDEGVLLEALRRPLLEARNAGRLVVTEGLVGQGHAAAVTCFEVDDDGKGGRRVVLEWEEPRVYTNVKPGHRRVEGTLKDGRSS